jgi:hypothetical protein
VTGLGNVPPSTGGRVSLELRVTESERVVYACTLLYGAEQRTGAAHVDLASGAVTLEGLDEAPAWLTTLTHQLVRQAWRGVPTLPWPRRITRWRAQ